jgi:hypothetical protein
MPYEEITRGEYAEKVKNLKPLSFESIYDPKPERFCDTDNC